MAVDIEIILEKANQLKTAAEAYGEAKAALGILKAQIAGAEADELEARAAADDAYEALVECVQAADPTPATAPETPSN